MEGRRRREGLFRLHGQILSAKATSSTPSTPTATRPQNCWCISCVNAATISTRENLMRQATSLKGYVAGSLRRCPACSTTTSPTDYRVNKQMQMMRFNGERWGCSARSSRIRSGWLGDRLSSDQIRACRSGGGAVSLTDGPFRPLRQCDTRRPRRRGFFPSQMAPSDLGRIAHAGTAVVLQRNMAFRQYQRQSDGVRPARLRSTGDDRSAQIINT